MRHRWRGPAPPKAPRPKLRDLWGACREFKLSLFDEGGATIDTLDLTAGERCLFARTLVQADGDVLCLVTERYTEDEDLRLAHREKTASWFRDLQATVDGVAATTRRATGWVSLLVVAVTTVTVTAVSTIVVGVLVALVTSVAVPVLVRQGLRYALGRVLR